MLHNLPMTMLALSLAFLLSACAEEPPALVGEVSRPVKTLVVEGVGDAAARNFPARIDANEKAELAFRVAGKVQELLVKEGDAVEAGQVVAKLDPKDYQIVVNDRSATYENARKNFDRAKELIEKGHISKMDYDRLEAEFKNSRAALETARQDLNYATLKAPFKGIIAKRYIQQFEEVQAKQAVLDLQNVSLLEVKFDVPESMLRNIRESSQARDRVKAFALFDGLAGSKIPLTFKELSTKADAKTQTFEATYTMQQLSNATVLPGMTATVTLDVSQVVQKTEQIFTLPVSAVVGDYKLDPRIWLVDEASMTVKPQAVKVGRLLGDSIEVLEGVEPGSRVVIAGAPFLVENMRVTLMPMLEQAQPRPEDLKYQ
jgi:RND family efflux transporter MFP subunit